MKTILSITALGLALSACSPMDSKPMHTAAPAPRDGELNLPADYRSWPVFMQGIQKNATKQIRDIYVNTQGTRARAGEAFPDGTQFVMEIHSVRLDAAGTPVLDANGQMIKDKLSKVFLMAKGPGWGASAPAALKSGDWIYTSYEGSGARSGPDMSSCRACHLPLADKDFVFHYDAWFKQRGAAARPTFPALDRTSLAAAGQPR